MKTLYLTLLLSAIGLGATAANNNADKTIRVLNKEYSSPDTYNYPTVDGGAYLVYNPRLVLDSLLITRLDATGAITWSKKVLDVNATTRLTTTNDNGIVIVSQGKVDGNIVFKLSSTGTVDYAYELSANQLLELERAEDGGINIFSNGGSITNYGIGSNGILGKNVIITGTSSFSDPLLGSTVTVTTSTGEIIATTVSNGKLAAVKTDNAGVPLFAKTYDVSGTELVPLKHVRLRNGNIVVVGLNKTTGTSFAAKIDENNGNLLWMKDYAISFGTFTTTVTSQTYDVNVAGFERLVEMPDGSITIAALCTYTGFFTGMYSAVVNIAADGAPLSSHYISNDVRAITYTTLDQDLRYNNLINLNGQADNYFLGCKKFVPDSNNTTLISLSNIPLLCKAVAGSMSVTDLTPTENSFMVSTTLDSTARAITLSVVDNTMDLVVEELCLNTTQAQTTGLDAVVETDISIMPNPANVGAQLKVKLSDVSGIESMSVLDISGKVLIRKNDIHTDNIISLQGLAKGTYIVQLSGSNKTINRKLIVTE